jgi:antitoxin component of MazEF toxin-antitoxin module
MYIRVYTCRMRHPVSKVVKVRRVGNSNVISLPREFEQSGYTPGTLVLVSQSPDGVVQVVPMERLRLEHPAVP